MTSQWRTFAVDARDAQRTQTVRRARGLIDVTRAAILTLTNVLAGRRDVTSYADVARAGESRVTFASTCTTFDCLQYLFHLSYKNFTGHCILVIFVCLRTRARPSVPPPPLHPPTNGTLLLGGGTHAFACMHSHRPRCQSRCCCATSSLESRSSGR